MTDPIQPWSIYEGRLSAGSAGRLSLEKAFAMLLLDRTGFESWELPEIFSGPDDDGETGMARELVRLDAELMSEAFLNGRISTFARPINGGDVIALKPNVWEIDEPIERFAVASLNIDQWMNANAKPTHRIFIDEEQFMNWARKLQRPETLTEDQIDRILNPFGSAKPEAAELGQPDDLTQILAQALPSDRPGAGATMLKLPEVCKMVGLSASSIYARIEQERFPKQLKLGGSSRWLASEIEDWIKHHADNRLP